MLLQESIENFQRIAPLILPDLLGEAKMGEADLLDEYAIVPYTLTKQFKLDDVMDMLEDQMELTILYHYIPSVHTCFGHQCCAYSDCQFGHMFKVHATTNVSGMIEALVVTVYTSMEVMCMDLLNDLELHEKSGKFLHKRDKSQILVEFC